MNALSKALREARSLHEVASTDTVDDLLAKYNTDDAFMGADGMTRLAVIGAMIVKGKGDVDPYSFPKEAIDKGIQVEMEHVPEGAAPAAKTFVAAYIAAAHLKESESYYDKLEQMEKDL